MERRRTLAMFDSLVAAGDEGLSFDGIVSIPEIGLEHVGYRPRLAVPLTGAHELYHTTRASMALAKDMLSRWTPPFPLPHGGWMSPSEQDLQAPQADAPDMIGASPAEEELDERLPRMREEYVHDEDPIPHSRQDSQVAIEIPIGDVLRSLIDLDEHERLPRTRAEDDAQTLPSEQSAQVPSLPLSDVLRPLIDQDEHERLPRMREDNDAQTLPGDRGEQVSEERLPRKNVPRTKIDQTLRSTPEISTDDSPESPPSYRCTTCQSTSDNPRNLVLLIDGTSNKFGPEKSNVRKLSLQIKMDGKKIEQRKHYLKGIGAYEDSHLSLLKRIGNTIISPFEMAFGWNVEKNVKDAYGWLVETYRKGDQIYLFGFSRGAYQVRELAGMIHEIGLVRERQEIERAHRIYHSIDHSQRRTSDTVRSFKKEFCWPGVRIHFVGVWDTVSSVGLIKRDVHVTASASVTNACHFRHALALDECRVKFMPEYFAEVNAYRSDVESSRPSDGDVKEVWFAGCHSDVGGANQQRNKAGGEGLESHSMHAGNVPLLWMRQEAAANGLVFEPEMVAWGAHDVDLGREDSLTWLWKFFEILPIRQQVSFSGTGKHQWRLHLSRPRSVIPGQHIHPSVLFGSLYTPRAILGDGIDIPIVRGEAGGLWAPGRQDEEAVTRLLAPILNEREATLKSLEKVLFLLVSRLDNGQLQTIPRPQWSEESIVGQSGFTLFALAVIYDITSNFSLSGGLLRDARESLCDILSSPNQQHFPVTLYVLRFLTKHDTLRGRFIAHYEVIRALMFALEWTATSRNGTLFPLVMENLGYLISDNAQRTEVIDQLTTTRIWLSLSVIAPSHLIAFLRMVTCVAQYKRSHCEHLRFKIIDLAIERRSPVGIAAVEALIALDTPLHHYIHFSNILGYLGNCLPRLDVEIGSCSSTNDIGDFKLPSVLLVDGSGDLDEERMRELVGAIKSWVVDERTLATLTLLKLCSHAIVQEYCLNHKNRVLDVFLNQLRRQSSSLLAAYALLTCLKHGMWTSDGSITRAAQPIVTMFTKGWFDNTVGRVEGFTIFRELMTFGNSDSRPLRRVVEKEMLCTLMKKLEAGGNHEIRMSLICLDILEEGGQIDLNSTVETSLRYLKDNDRDTQQKGVRILSALAQTKPGERAIMTHMRKIVRMLPSSSARVALARQNLEAIHAALHNLFRNERLRDEITSTREYDDFAAFLAAQRASRASLLVTRPPVTTRRPTSTILI